MDAFLSLGLTPRWRKILRGCYSLSESSCEERAQFSRRRASATADPDDPQPYNPHDLTQPKTNPQHLECRDNGEDARHGDHHAKGVQCSGMPSCQQSCPSYQQNPYAAYNLNPADQCLRNIQHAQGSEYIGEYNVQIDGEYNVQIEETVQ